MARTFAVPGPRPIILTETGSTSEVTSSGVMVKETTSVAVTATQQPIVMALA